MFNHIHRRAEEKIKREADQLIAAARATRTEFHPPFRTCPYPSSPVFDPNTPPQGGGSPSTCGGGNALGVEGLDVRDNWDSSDDEVEGRVEAFGDGASASELKGSLEHGKGSSDLEENSSKPVEISPEHGEGSLDREGSSVIDGGNRSLEHGKGSLDLEENPSKHVEISSEHGEGSLDIEAEEGSSDLKQALSGNGAATAVAVNNLGGDVSDATPSAVSTKRASKWGNSVIKGRLSRPSDGRVPTVEQESRERQERVEKLR